MALIYVVFLKGPNMNKLMINTFLATAIFTGVAFAKSGSADHKSSSI